ncbi:MAG: cadmium-translocating P-type ATPase [Leptolyngbya sp. SIO1E4]|nr:cadmium-translocating P-type ATPase [Leptolyngbya sp. SIO1E4]
MGLLPVQRLWSDHSIEASPSACQGSWRVLHQLPNRVRIRVPELATHARSGARLQSTLGELSGVNTVRINRAACSVVIQYAPWAADRVQAKLIEVLGELSTLPTPAPLSEGGRASQNQQPMENAGRILQANSSAGSSADSGADSGKGGHWDDLRLPVLASVLAFASRFSRFQRVQPLAIATLTMAIFPIARRAFHSLWRQRRLNIDCLDLLALSLSAWQGKLLTPALVITLHELGDAIREQTARATEVRASTLADAIGHFAWVQGETGELRQIPSRQVCIDDVVVVHPGEQIPVDGTVLSGEATVDQQGLTGEAMPIVASSGSYVFASTLVRSGQLTLQAERIGDNTRAASGLRLLQQAPVYDTRMANYTEKVADRLIVPSLLLATLVLGLTRDPARAAAILTLDFVTGIRVSIPTAFLGALNHTTRHGVMVRSGRTLEQLAEVDTIVFDKTGTLTQGTIAIATVCPVADTLSPARLLQLAATAEKRLTHPVAEAIVHHAQQQGIDLLPRGDWDYLVGFGVTAQIEGHTVLVGSERFLTQKNVAGLQGATTPANGCSQIYVAQDGQFVGTLGYTDPLRPESARLVHLLQKDLELDLHLLTGDTPQRASQVAQELGIPAKRVYAEAFPDHKAKIVQNLRREGRTVAFVGDGLNDSVALAYADVSVSFEQAADVARETADVVLMDNDLLELLEAIEIARQTRDLIEQNIALVVGPNLVALGLASTLSLSPLVATIIHNGSAIVAGLNSLRPLVEHKFAPNSVVH